MLNTLHPNARAFALWGGAAVVFLADLATPLGVATPLLYLGLLPLGFSDARRPEVWKFPIAAAGLAIAGALLGPPGDLAEGWTNRGLVILALLAYALLARLSGRRVKGAGDRARDAKAYAEALWRASPDAIFACDSSGTILDTNAAADTLLGVAPGALVGRSVDALVPAAARHAHAGHRASYHNNPTLRAMGVARQAQMERSDGSVVDVEVRLAPVNLAPVAVIATVRDVTALLERERQLQAAKQVEAVGKLAFGIAHEFNNLLAVILAYANLAREGLAGDDPRLADLSEVEGAAQRARCLTSQLLGLSHTDPDHSTLVDVAEVVAAAVALARPVLPASVILRESPPPAACPARAAPQALEQAVLNLILNARDAVHGGGVVLVSTRLDGDRVVVRVEDNGAGVAPEAAGRLFEPFFTTKGHSSGTGLGLHLVRETVRRAGGSVALVPKSGPGAAFELWLPLDRATPTPQAPERGEREAHALIIEDRPELAAIAARALLGAGWRTTTLGNPALLEGVLQALGEPAPVALIGELTTPGAAEATTRMLRERSPETRVVQVAQRGARGPARGVGAEPHAILVAPFTPAELVAKLEHAR